MRLINSLWLLALLNGVAHAGVGAPVGDGQASLSAEHQAIFCGRPGSEEASRAYSEALSALLATSRRRGMDDKQALQALRLQYCEAAHGGQK
jgi:hypothetical protein